MATLRLLLLAALLAAPLAAAPNKEHDCDCHEEATLAERATDAVTSPAGAGLGVAVAGSVAWLGARRLRGLPLVPPAAAFWSRIRPGEAVRHPARARLLELVRARPGVATADLAQAAGMNEATLLHHLETLERSRFVKSVRVGRDRVWFEAGAVRPDAGTLSALHAPARKQILDLVAKRPGLAQAELVHELGLAKATVSHHVAELRRAGLVEARREGLRVRLYATARADAPTA